MKKFLSVIITVAIICALWIPAMAEESVVTHHITVGDNSTITVKKGDLIEVTYRVNSPEEVEVITMQNEILYDHTLLELVPGSNKGLNGYRTSVQVNSEGKHFVYFNTMTNTIINQEGIVAGTAQFKVIGEEGTATIKNTSCIVYKSDQTQIVDTISEDEGIVTIIDNNKHSGGKKSVDPDEKDEPKEYINKFSDINTEDYYYDAVKWAVLCGITSGTDETHFSPFDITTRAQMVTFIWRASGRPEPGSGKSKFVDIESGSAYEKAIIWATEKGIAKGISDTEFAPNLNVTRGQAVAFLARTSGIEDDSVVRENPFEDVYPTDYYNNAVSWASENNIAQGISETKFAPKDDCLRAQIITFLYRYYEKK